MKNLPRVVLEIGAHCLQAHVARGAAERALGLQHRAELAADEAMLFVSDAPAWQSFWMKDTPLALSAAFLDEAGCIVHLVDMEPHSEETHRCPQPVRYVLETNRGWFGERGIGVGAQVVGPPFADQG